MPANITTRKDGTVEAAFAFTPAWHNTGTVVQKAPDGPTMRKISHIDFPVEQWELYAQGFQGNQFIKTQADGLVANVRTDTGDILGIVSEKYKLLQNGEAFDFVDELHMDGVIKYESAGSLKGGKVVWLLARMPGEGFTLGTTDENRLYLLFVNSFDATRSIQCFPTEVRVVCWNTLNLALRSDKSKSGFSIRHTGDLKKKLAVASNMMQIVRSDFKGFQQDAQVLASRSVSKAILDDFVMGMIPDPEKESKNAQTRRDNARSYIRQAFLTGPQMLDGIRGSAWAMFNAYTQWIDHESTSRGKTDQARYDNRMLSSMMSKGAVDKNAALELALALSV